MERIGAFLGMQTSILTELQIKMNFESVYEFQNSGAFPQSDYDTEPVPHVLAPAATGVDEFINQHGGDVDRVFGEAGVDQKCIGNPTEGMSLKSFCGLFESASENTRNDNFGLWFGNQFQPNDLGLWGYAAISSPTLGNALDNLIDLFRYHQQCSMMRLASASNGYCNLEYQVRDPQIFERRQDAELSLGMFLNVIREGAGTNWQPEEIYFEHPKPENSSEHEKAFDAPVFFSQKINAIVFNPAVLENKMPNSDLKLMSLTRTCLESLHTNTPFTQNLTDRIRNIIRIKLADGYPSLELVAESIYMSTSAIQRSLAWEGLSYTDLVEETRKSLAEMYFKQRNLSLSEIAYLLGYSELSAFSRAFRRWTGLSPREYRGRSSEI